MSNFVSRNSVTIHRPRNRFTLKPRRKFTMNVGTLYPTFLKEVMPGETFQDNIFSVVKPTSAFIKNVIDDCFVDHYFFYVPLRILYDDFTKVFGQADPNSWAENEDFEIPVTQGSANIAPKSVGDYLGLAVVGTNAPRNVGAGLSLLPFRAFAKIYNDWFRDQDVIDPMNIQTGGFVSSEQPNTNPWSPDNYTGMLPKVAKMHDYFTSAFPDTQKGQIVDIPIAQGLASFLPLTTNGNTITSFASTPMLKVSGSPSSGGYNLGLGLSTNGGTGAIGLASSFGAPTAVSPATGSNLGVDVSDSNSTTLNDLRILFSAQRYLEKLANFGSRYNEFLYAFFGVDAQDARLQRSEFIGGKRLPMHVSAIPQTTVAETDSVTNALGNMAGTMIGNGSCYAQHYCPEHGYIIGVTCVRYLHTYQQGIDPLWLRRTKFDFYNPEFAHIGYQPIYSSELYAYSGDVADLKENIFGYKPAWDELRSMPSLVMGQMRSDVPNSLDVFHFADFYSGAPTISQEFVEETPAFVDRTLAVPSTSGFDQFAVDIQHDIAMVAPLPLNSYPKLIG